MPRTTPPCHPVQWNAAASHRVRTYGAATVVEGDLVLPRAAVVQRAASRNRRQARRQQQAEADGGADAEAGAGAEAAGTAEDGTAVTEGAEGAEELEEGADGLAEAHVVTAAEAAAGAFSIDDVVLPLPGHAVRLPEHATADVYRSLAAADGVSLDSSPHGTQDFSMAALPGAYRHVIHRPADLEVGGKGVTSGPWTLHAGKACRVGSGMPDAMRHAGWGLISPLSGQQGVGPLVMGPPLPTVLLHSAPLPPAVPAAALLSPRRRPGADRPAGTAGPAAAAGRGPR